MARNTDIGKILFPVHEERVYLAGQSKPVPRFKAIIGTTSKGVKKTFSVVSDEYKLITNQEALQMAKDIHLKLFSGAKADSFEVFNIIAPDTKSFCQIDIIDKNYTLNILKQEVYVPFVRIHNSYNKSRSLKFDIGFCRKLCDNGVIFEKNTVMLRFAHTKQQLNNKDLIKVNVDHLKKLETEFKNLIEKSTEIPLPVEYFVPLAAKVLGRNFNLSEKNPNKLEVNVSKMNDFVQLIQTHSKKYIGGENFGQTAYAFFNVLTDYVSNNNALPAGSINGLQTKCGMWINQVGNLVQKPGFSWEQEIKEYTYLLN